MGYLYVKVIEARKVAIRTSFYVNYPFVRLLLNGKEQRNTNYRPGIEWWDKIFSYRLYRYNQDDQYLLVQARDKSIHVFGSDWIGESKINLKDFYDGRVHQKWIKLGKGRKYHRRGPKGYIHIAFHYFDNVDHNVRPFAQDPVERVLTFEEYLATTEDSWSEDGRYVSSYSANDINETPNHKKIREQQANKELREKRNRLTQSDSTHSGRSRGTIGGSTLSKSDAENDLNRSQHMSDYEDSLESDREEDQNRTGNLIDFEDIPTIRSLHEGMFPPLPNSINPSFFENINNLQSLIKDNIKDNNDDINDNNDNQTSENKTEETIDNAKPKEELEQEYTSTYTGKNPFLVDNTEPLSNLSISAK